MRWLPKVLASEEPGRLIALAKVAIGWSDQQRTSARRRDADPGTNRQPPTRLSPPDVEEGTTSPIAAPAILTRVRLPRLRPVELAKRVIGAAAQLAPSPTATSSNSAPASPQATTAGQRSERTGKYDEELIALVRRRPGTTVAEAAQELKLHPTALYPVIRRLETRRQIQKIGRGLQPARENRSTPGARRGPERLWCEAGHFWERTPTRGRKPKRCPRHR